jgi:hypothetical protein
MHTQEYWVRVQIAVTVTLIPATTKVEKMNKDTSGGARKRIRRDIFYQRVRDAGGSGGRLYVERNTSMA